MNWPIRSMDDLPLILPENRTLFDRALRKLLGLTLTLVLVGCASSGLYQMTDSWCQDHPGASSARCVTPAQPWDQENLKCNDSGCPTAIFIAPGGNLEQC